MRLFDVGIMIFRLNKTGFTKIEAVSLVISLVIMGLLVFLVWRAYAQGKRDQSRMENVNAIHFALLEYLKNEGRMPPNTERLIGDPCGKDQEAQLFKELFLKGYLDVVPTDDRFEYCYYDYGISDRYGAMIGIKVEGKVSGSCLSPVEYIWCGKEGWYCICQPYTAVTGS